MGFIKTQISHNYIIVLTLINAFEYTIEYFQWKFSKTYLNSP